MYYNKAVAGLLNLFKKKKKIVRIIKDYAIVTKEMM